MTPHSIPSSFSGRKFLLYVPLATAVALVPSIVLVAIAVWVALWLDPDFLLSRPAPRPETLYTIFISSIPIPFVETWILMWIIHKVRRFAHRPVSIAAVTAIICAVAYELAIPFQFFAIVWSFFVFAYGFLIWQPYSSRYALFAMYLPHALLNLLVGLSTIFLF